MSNPPKTTTQTMQQKETAQKMMKHVDTDDTTALREVRQSVYGPPIVQFNVAQRLKFIMNEAFKANKIEVEMSGTEMNLICEATDMIAVKLARIATGDPTYLDNWDDIAGYCRCVTDYFRGETETVTEEE